LLIQHWPVCPKPVFLTHSGGGYDFKTVGAAVFLRDCLGDCVNPNTNLGTGIEMARQLGSLKQKTVRHCQIIAVDKRPARCSISPNLDLFVLLCTVYKPAEGPALLMVTIAGCITAVENAWVCSNFSLVSTIQKKEGIG
jgi:hypothetical protein